MALINYCDYEIKGTLTVGGIITAPGGTSTEWNTSYDNMVTGIAFSGTTTKTLTLTQQDGGVLTASFTDNNDNTNYYTTTATFNTSNGIISFSGAGGQPAYSVDIDGRYALSSVVSGVTSINFKTDGTALNVASNTITTSGTMTGVWQGTSSQYVNGEGNLITFPSVAGTYNFDLTGDSGTSATVTSGSTVSIIGSSTISTTSNGFNVSIEATTAAVANGGTALASGDQIYDFVIGQLPSVNNNTITLSAGTGLSGGGAFTLNQSSNETITFNNSITNNNQLTNGSGYITASSTDTLTNKSGNISQWTNDSGYITSASLPTVNNGTLTMTTSTGLDGGTTFTANQSGNSTFAVTLDLSELTDMTAAMTGSDEFIVLDSGAERRKAASEIGLSIFSNDAGFTTNVGDITAVTVTAPITGGGTSGSVGIGITQATTSANGYLSSTDWNTFNNKTGNTGDITGVTAGTNLTGGGTSGSVTLNMATGGAGAASYGSTSDSIKIDTITLDAYGRVTAVATGATGQVNTVATGNSSTLTSSGTTAKTLTPVTATVNASSAALATGAQIQTAINSALTGVLQFEGTWNASTNSPSLSSGTGTSGDYYIVSVAGSTNLDGITDWAIGDWAVFANTTWTKIDNSQVGNVTGSGSSGRVAYWNSTSGITSDAGLTFDGGSNALTVSGAVTWSGGSSGESNSAYDNMVTGFGNSGSSTKLLTLTQQDGGTLTTSFSIPQGTVTSVATSAPITGGTITGSGTIGITQATTSASGYLTSTNWNTFNNKTSNLGTVTSVTVSGSSGISGSGTVTTSGSIALTNSDKGSSQSIFKNIAVSGQSTVVADSNNDTLTFAAAGGMTITTDATTDTITFNPNDDNSNYYVSGASYASGTLTLTRNGLSTLTATGFPTNNNQLSNGEGYTTNAGTVTSVNFKTDGTALNVASNTITTSGTMTGIWQGTSAQYVNGLGDLTTFPSIPQGDITGVTAGTGMSGGGTSGTVTLNCTITNNNQLTNGAGYITGVTAGVGLSGGGTSGTPTLTLDLGELGAGGTLIAGDYLIAENGGVDNRQLISSIPLSIFNNNSGWTNVTNNNQITNGAGYITSYTNTQNIFTSSWVDSGTNALLRLTKSGASTGTQDITITPSTGISVTPTTSNLIITNTGNTTIGTNSDITLNDATVLQTLNMTQGVVTSFITRTLTLSNLGYSGATNANYITNNNQLTNGAGYITSAGNQGTVTSVGITAGTGISVSNSPITSSGNITVTNTSPNVAETFTSWIVRDDDNDDKTLSGSTNKYLKFAAATGTSGTNLTGTGTTADPYLMTITSPDSNSGGTVTGATSGSANTITVSASSTSPVISAVTAAVANGGTALATGDQINDFVKALNYGSVTSVTAGTGMTQTGTSTINPTLNVIGGDGIVAVADKITVDSTVVRTTITQSIGGTKTFTTTPISVTRSTADSSTYLATTAFVKNQGYTTNTGTVTSVATGTGLTGGTITGSGTVSVDYAGSDSIVMAAPGGSTPDPDDYFIYGSDSSDDGSSLKFQFVDTPLSIFNNDLKSQTQFTSNFLDSSSSTSYFYIPFNSTSESTSSQYYNHLACAQPGTVKKIMMMHTSGTASTSFTTQLRVVKNGITAATSGELTPSNGANDGSYVEYLPNTTFVKGDRIRIGYQKSATSKYWQGVSAIVIFEFTPV